jgi:hypothetical protein
MMAAPSGTARPAPHAFSISALMMPTASAGGKPMRSSAIADTASLAQTGSR